MTDTPTYCMVTMVPVDVCPHCFDMRDLERPIQAFFRKLFCRHVWIAGDRYVGFQLVPEAPNGGFPAMKERRRCPLCNRRSTKTLYLT